VFSARLRQSSLYFNAELVRISQDIGVNRLRGNGDLILGQDQDAVNAGRLDPNQAYK